MNPTLLIILGIVFLVIGIALLAYFGIKYIDHNKKSTVNTVLMVIGAILSVAGIALIIWYVVATKRTKKQKLADAGIEMASLGEMPMMENAYTTSAMNNRAALLARTPAMPRYM